MFLLHMYYLMLAARYSLSLRTQASVLAHGFIAFIWFYDPSSDVIVCHRGFMTLYGSAEVGQRCRHGVRI